MKMIAVVIACIMVLSITGCAKKSPSEQFAADAKKAANQLNKDAQNMFK